MTHFLVIGESCNDVYHYGEVNRLAPDAPIPIICPTRTTYTSGMAGNVAANLVSLGATRVDTILSTPPITKTRYVDEVSGYILLRVDENDRVTVRFNFEEFRAKLDETRYNACVVSSYGKGFLTEEDIKDIALLCKARGIPTFVDHKFILGDWSRAITWVKINEREYNAQIKAGVMCPQRYCENLVVTLGNRGSRWMIGGDCSGMNTGTYVDVKPVAVSDLSGAGDTFLSGFVAYLTRHPGMVTAAMDYANRVARVAVSKRGVVAVSQSDLEENP